jgi:hypothetical protein
LKHDLGGIVAKRRADPYRRGVVIALAAFNLGISATISQLPPFKKSATALCCASRPKPERPCRVVLTRKYATYFPVAQAFRRILTKQPKASIFAVRWPSRTQLNDLQIEHAVEGTE